MRVLVMCDDQWHPAKTVRMGLDPLARKGYVFNWLEDASLWSEDLMADCPVVIFSKANNASETDTTAWMTDTVQNAFMDYVRQGHGLLVLHSGTVGYKETRILRALMGGVFLEHPPQCAITVNPVPDHELSAGVEAFTIVDEHYSIALDDTQAEVFMHTRSEYGVQPGGWTRTEGNGRVCVMTPGHDLSVWMHPMYQALLANSLRWLSGA